MITLVVYVLVGLVSYLALLHIQGSFKGKGTKKGGKR